jgi:ribosomal protein S14
MRTQRLPSPAVRLACFLSLWAAASILMPTRAVAHPAPTLTTALRVNGIVTECGASVRSGDEVCLLLRSDQDGFAVVTIRKGNGPDVLLAKGNVEAGRIHRVCVTAGVADGIIRTFTLKVTNAEKLTSVRQCSYFVDKSAAQAPFVQTALRKNGVIVACGAKVASGDEVCLLFRSNQDGFAVVKLRKGHGADTILASGKVQAGRVYRVCVIAGAADGILRTFTVKVTNALDLSTTEECGYVVK